MGDTEDIDVFYHGINSSMIFSGTTIKLNGPVSTTIDFNIAVNQFGSQGIVIDIARSNGATAFFNCVWWSDYSNENERFFIGGMTLFTFLTIRNIPDKKNYSNFIAPMTFFHWMIQGYSQSQRAIRKSDLKYLSRMISEEINDTFVLS
eukprot:526206_1